MVKQINGSTVTKLYQNILRYGVRYDNDITAKEQIIMCKICCNDIKSYSYYGVLYTIGFQRDDIIIVVNNGKIRVNLFRYNSFTKNEYAILTKF